MKKEDINIFNDKDEDIVMRAINDAQYAASDEFIDWLGESEEHKKIYQDFMFYRQSMIFAHQDEQLDVNAAWQAFMADKHSDETKEPIHWARIVKIAISAAAVVAFGFLFLQHPKTQDAIESKLASFQQEIQHSDSSSSQEAAATTNESTAKAKAQKLMAYIADYQEMIDNGTIRTEEMQVVEGKRGEPKHLVLEDGTEVWLNVGSRISYLKHFGKGPRIVDLKGEAYFKVKHDAENPFVVRTPYFNTVDKGTSFNVKAYDRKTASVTLCEGEVAVSLPQAEQGITLQPGERITCGASNTLSVNKVNINTMTAWMHGQFNYDGATLGEIFDDLARHYGKQIIVKDEDVLDKRIKFWASYEDNFMDVLNTIILTSGIDITMVDGSNCVYIVKHKD